ncbi:MAG: 3-hydroxyacyl-CoA dehydrogenase NAD-binding domain-containing protein [Gemmatales bacterium]|nr:3-hydroxyacyl-CoA dehydrogenase NAD-binding domain-containing protein [Gemmatales bacterium]MDW7994486.1 3-hydroxyacyl-CoA dehydrogenase NAD-binding domain-containing protein [Gemmatales bacterium]
MAQKAVQWRQLESGEIVITIDQPESKVNVVSQAVLAELEQALAEVARLAPLAGIILTSGKPGIFLAGADLRELAQAWRYPELVRQLIERGHALLRQIENLPGPTVAAIDGPCLGGGLEIALAFDHRLVTTNPRTELGLPEVKVGLIPGWGGTQRLPRLIGPALALDMICTGDSIPAARAVEIGLVFDAVAADRLLEEAKRLLYLARQQNDWPAIRRRKQQPVGLSEEQHAYTFAVARGQVWQKTRGRPAAPLAALEVVDKTVKLPLEDGLRYEQETFLRLATAAEARNLIAVFFQQQRLQKDPGVSQAFAQPRNITRVGVLGAGIMGSGISGVLARRGLFVQLSDVSAEILNQALQRIERSFLERVQTGRWKPEEAADALARIGTTQTLAAMADRELVIEAVTENFDLKTRLFSELERHVGPDTLLVSNTSTLSITQMARVLQRPERFAGFHFFNPAERMPLVEVIRGEKTADDTVIHLVAFAKRIGKTPIVVKDSPGFLVNRILFPYLNEAMLMLEEGVEPRELDRIAVEFGMPMGPVTLQDVVGLDTALFAGRVLQQAFPDRFVENRIVAALVEAGRLGQKSGAGFYSYAKDPRQGADDPALLPILQHCRREHRKISPEEITDRLFLPMLTEAIRVLSEGIVRDPGDVDMGLILGIGFPAWRGGILRWADELGADAILQRLERYQYLGPRFAPPPLLQELAQQRRKFYPDGNP